MDDETSLITHVIVPVSDARVTVVNVSVLCAPDVSETSIEYLHLLAVESVVMDNASTLLVHVWFSFIKEKKSRFNNLRVTCL